MSGQIKAVIWDMDGVIIDSAQGHLLSFHRMALEAGLPFKDEDFWTSFGMRNDLAMMTWWGAMPAEQLQSLANKKEEYFREYIHGNAIALPGAIELMAALKVAGFKQALASSAPVKNVEVISAELGLDRYLERLVSGENVPHGKPAPDVFLQAAKELEVDPTTCLVIEDAVVGVQAAHAGGMCCIAVAGVRDLPGLRAADLMVHDLTEVSVAQITALFNKDLDKSQS